MSERYSASRQIWSIFDFLRQLIWIVGSFIISFFVWPEIQIYCKCIAQLHIPSVAERATKIPINNWPCFFNIFFQYLLRNGSVWNCLYRFGSEKQSYHMLHFGLWVCLDKDTASAPNITHSEVQHKSAHLSCEKCIQPRWLFESSVLVIGQQIKL